MQEANRNQVNPPPNTSSGPMASSCRPGFTIVELLIVIVVIAVLATITIVAFNGIQKRAQAASVTAALNHASKRVRLYQVDNGGYPATLAAASVTDSDVTYQYTGTLTSYCITGTKGSSSLYVSDTQASPSTGGCAGHGQGGVAAITNLAATPKPLSLNLNHAMYWGVGGAGSMGIYNDTGLGRTIWRATWTTAPSASGGAYWYSDAIVVPGSRYQLSQTIRSSKNITVQARLVWVNAASTAETGNSSLGAIALSAGVSRRIGGSAIAPPGTGRMRITAYASGSTWAIGDTLDTWDTMFVQSDNTSLYNYADGSSPNWVWNGTANASTSTGPPL